MRIPNNAIPSEEGLTYLNRSEAKLLGFDEDGNKCNAYVYLKPYDHNFECFSSWTPSELKEFTDFVNRLRQCSWTNIYKSGGGYKKTSFGYTIHRNWDLLPNQKLRDTLSPDMTLFELRVSQKLRVHGY